MPAESGKDLTMKYKEISSELIQEIRQQVLDTAAKSIQDYDRIDLDRIEKTDEMIIRFTLEHMENNDNGGKIETTTTSCQKVCSKLCETLRWRHEFGINNIKDSDFPHEFYECDLIASGIVAAGHVSMVLKIDRLIRLKHWSDLWVRFIVHEMEKVCIQMTSKEDFFESEKAHVISDARDAGLAQMNLHFLMTIIPIFFHHYPQCVASIWLYEIPYFCMALKPIIMRTLPDFITRKVIFTDQKSLMRDMRWESLPHSYGGSPDNILKQASAHSCMSRSLSQVGRENQIPDHEIRKMSSDLTALIHKIKKQQQSSST